MWCKVLHQGLYNVILYANLQQQFQSVSAWLALAAFLNYIWQQAKKFCPEYTLSLVSTEYNIGPKNTAVVNRIVIRIC